MVDPLHGFCEGPSSEHACEQECNCSWEKKSDEGKNALEYAKLNKKEDILAWAARGFEDIEEEEVPVAIDTPPLLCPVLLHG